jgi:hypothetical protein
MKGELKVARMGGASMRVPILQIYMILGIVYFENAEINGDCLGPT